MVARYLSHLPCREAGQEAGVPRVSPHPNANTLLGTFLSMDSRSHVTIMAGSIVLVTRGSFAATSYLYVHTYYIVCTL